MEPKDVKRPAAKGELEGEGNKTADKQYREGATRFAKSSEAMRKAEEAARDLDKNPEEYRRAEERGRAPGKGGEDLADDVSGKDFDKI